MHQAPPTWTILSLKSHRISPWPPLFYIKRLDICEFFQPGLTHIYIYISAWWLILIVDIWYEKMPSFYRNIGIDSLFLQSYRCFNQPCISRNQQYELRNLLNYELCRFIGMNRNRFSIHIIISSLQCSQHLWHNPLTSLSTW